jgi:oligosaccharide repeat unit polymerase
MILVAIAMLSLMGLANYWIGKRFLYPPVVFCAVWAADLALVRLAGNFFYPMADETLAIFCLGALAVSIGGGIALLVPIGPVSDQPMGKYSNRILNLLLLVVVCAAPFVVVWIVDLASNFESATLLVSVSRAILEADEAQDPSWSLFGNVMTLALIVAMIAYLQRGEGKKRAFLAIAVALLLIIAGAGRSGIVILLLSFVCLSSIRTTGIPWKALIGIFLSLVIIAGAMAIAIEKGEARSDAPLAENLVPVFQGFVLYAAGGLVAFDRVVRQPSIIPHNWQITTPLLLVANKLGAHFDVPFQHSEFVDVGPQGLDQNVYTMYFAYFDLGRAGMMLAIAFMGFVVTTSYRLAIAGSKLSTIIYSYFFGALLLSPFSDLFFMGLNFSVKLFIVAWLVFRLPDTLIKLRSFSPRWKSLQLRG